MPDTPVIVVRDLVKRYGDFTAVDGLSFDVERGEVFGLLGPNGAGKTTTISMLSCLTPPTSGRATIAGIDVTADSLAARSRIGVVPQEVALYPTLSARENLTFWGRMYGVPERALRSRIDELLETVKLADRASGRIDTFSGGMKRRINIAAGLLHRPEVLFLDEPTVGIDPQTRRSILELVLSLNEQGLTVLYTTHYLEEAEFLCDRIGIMDEGRMIAVGSHKELTESIGATQTIRIVADGLDPSTVRRLEQMDDVSEAVHSERELSLNARVGANLLPVIVDSLSSSGAAVSSIEVDDPNLESVFLHLTGRSLRDDASDDE
jgi:ABC-2 type transport system ATP-binding protein